MDTQYIPTLCHSVANIMKSLLGKNKKSVVLDLDNTLWGGIIGDDGPEGIVLGKETPTGMAYAEFQQYLKELSQLGVLLNVCSKNEDAIARQGFARADSVLKADDFLCFKANWEPKHMNIAAIAQELNILPDSLVFMDDNPAEREIVRRELPTVTVPELTAPEQYLYALDKAGYFEVTTLSADDKKRNEMYKQNLQRAAIQQSFGNYNDYLRSLEMHCEIGAFDAAHAERITQLINKTNQFNLTTRRYTAAEVESIMNDPNYITLYGRLVDKFGDNGIVTAIIAHKHGTEADIDLWIMSCRTFKRQLEHAMFDRLVAVCAAQGITRINGFYYPTAKNLLVSDFYATIGFDKTGEDEQGKTFAFTGFENYTPQCTVMETVLL
jgi:FkbH-like protein